ncbi:substrate-binding domain-containing protein [Paenibacillus sp. XY044]|uniref:GntR family transcriptional regulator n=1 Tax=Paenibacillus sp. XY044 TaxID=2026089 RepID=UPI000B986AAD|nr:GntR family transcriptional regulator [Paenibacillus sp. XY044]OZB91317.1 hypothetical protein CJP46_28950 [Paenibacillus sp. XY044]
MENSNKPLYTKLYQYLKEKIESSEYLPEQQLPTEVELAEQFGVSRITSKRALSELEREGYIYRKRGSGSYVKLRNVEDARQDNLPGAPNSMISMIFPFEEGGQIFGYIQGASDYLNAKGYFLSIHNTNYSAQKEWELLNTLPQRGIKGIILYPNQKCNLQVLYTLYMNEYPVVTIDKHYDSLPVSSVVADNFNGGYVAAERLIRLGHKRISFVSFVDMETTSSVLQRFFGYCQALKDHGLPLDNDIVINEFFVGPIHSIPREHYRNLLTQLLAKGVTAIQVENDLLASDFLKICAEMDIKVPEQMSIIGFDNSDFLEWMGIPLASVAQDLYEIGRRAAEIIVNMLESSHYLQEKVTIPVKLVERDSIGPCIVSEVK